MVNVEALRAEAQRLRALARNFADSKVLTAINQLVEESEARERKADNSGAPKKLNPEQRL